MLKHKNVICATSAGYTSVMMAIKMKEWYPELNVVNVFLNTSKEDSESLRFMNECDKHYGLNLVWVESVISQKKGVGSGFVVKKFNDILTNGEIFEQGIKKYGIPSRVNKWCNRELKVVPVNKFADSIFGKNNWSLAIGYRTDEIDRFSSSYRINNAFYPPYEFGINQRLRNKFWKDQPIQLNLKAYQGNCDFCFEKSKRKRMTIALENSEKLIWWNEMEKKYSLVEVEGKPQYNEMVTKGSAYFGRMNESIEQIIKDAQTPFSRATDEYVYEDDLLDFESDCGTSCSIH